MRNSVDGRMPPASGTQASLTNTQESGVSSCGTMPEGVTIMPPATRIDALPEVPRFSPDSCIRRITVTSAARASAASVSGLMPPLPPSRHRA